VCVCVIVCVCVYGSSISGVIWCLDGDCGGRLAHLFQLYVRAPRYEGVPAFCIFFLFCKYMNIVCI